MRLALAALFFTLTNTPAALEVGFAHTDITPAVGGDAKAVWIAGYGPGRSATGVHDPLFARAVVLRDTEADQRIALVSVDLVGFQRPAVLRVRAQFPGYAHITISSTHNHEGPDVIGIWGQNPLRSGVDPKYIDLVVERCVAAIRTAEENLASAVASYGTAIDKTLIGDSRLPRTYEGKLRALRFVDPTDKSKAIGVMIVWDCHPEAMGSRNRQITADFPAATIAVLEKQHSCPVAHFTGTVGGLLAPPRDRIKNAAGEFVKEGDWEYMRLYGEAVAGLANKALQNSKPIALTPFKIANKPVQLPVENKLYRAGFTAGVLKRESYLWQGADKRGEPLNKLKHALRTMAIETEVGYLQLGALGIVEIPGEIYPELVDGSFQNPADPGADFPDAELEPSVTSMIPTDEWLLLGLAADEVGYIIPKRQWDAKAPFAYGRDKSQYGEMNSCGPEVAAIIMRALADRITETR